MTRPRPASRPVAVGLAVLLLLAHGACGGRLVEAAAADCGVVEVHDGGLVHPCDANRVAVTGPSVDDGDVGEGGRGARCNEELPRASVAKTSSSRLSDGTSSDENATQCTPVRSAGQGHSGLALGDGRPHWPNAHTTEETASPNQILYRSLEPFGRCFAVIVLLILCFPERDDRWDAVHYEQVQKLDHTATLRRKSDALWSLGPLPLLAVTAVTLFRVSYALVIENPTRMVGVTLIAVAPQIGVASALATVASAPVLMNWLVYFKMWGSGAAANGAAVARTSVRRPAAAMLLFGLASLLVRNATFLFVAAFVGIGHALSDVGYGVLSRRAVQIDYKEWIPMGQLWHYKCGASGTAWRQDGLRRAITVQYSLWALGLAAIFKPMRSILGDSPDSMLLAAADVDFVNIKENEGRWFASRRRYGLAKILAVVVLGDVLACVARFFPVVRCFRVGEVCLNVSALHEFDGRVLEIRYSFIMLAQGFLVVLLVSKFISKRYQAIWTDCLLVARNYFKMRPFNLFGGSVTKGALFVCLQALSVRYMSTRGFQSANDSPDKADMDAHLRRINKLSLCFLFARSFAVTFVMLGGPMQHLSQSFLVVPLLCVLDTFVESLQSEVLGGDLAWSAAQFVTQLPGASQ